ncbi:MAG: sulfite reductase flavoprotein subunit alpha [Gammaproteobacteria bacterium]|nr:sulfite reductase flavoprotein subunit alpha [Gammaproteobacteria bacterium]MBU1491590.1 sulfite reductase flavoprotein subunit alpha [Gammaproteobacteria bacterium]MBU2066576.1 sulfite reductase flavoprotein subunit alpha [Gammaproteobacteria bacterium]MBU2137692.1 sulfite reductase flavoprotein subunit alpha [Gammaproteobacteria bacterium]MBU2215624.1 sulfite reductase flavoprotein subunit alpha [Gammaproteobacteria bacterium]
MFKKTVFQLHWLFGITGGLVLALMGVTGAAYAFRDELLLLLNPQVIQQQAGPVLTPGELVARAERESGAQVAGLWVDVTGERPARVFFTPPAGERRGASRYVDPYSGAQLPELRGQGFFDLMLQLHRFLALGEFGKQITAACTLMLVFFCLSGLYLRWPRQAASWRAWLTLDWARKGRSFNWDLHAVAGTWCLALYLLAALTGLFWSYEWYRDGVQRLLTDAPAGQAGERRSAGRGRPPAEPLDGPALVVDYTAVWAAIRNTAGPQLHTYNLRLPPLGGQPATVFYLLEGAAHPRAFDQLSLDPASGVVRRVERYSEKPLGAQLLASVYALHVGEFFGLPGRILMLLASLAMPLFAVTGWLLYLDRRRKKRAIRAAQGELGGAAGGETWLIGFASQSGFAEQLAWQSAAHLQAAGHPVQVQSLSQLGEQTLREARRALFVVSTFGDGEAPDSARAFERRVLGQALGLDHLRFALLALGDRHYPQFCGFAERVRGWLQQQGAQTLFEPVQVDAGDAQALDHWRSQLGALTGVQVQAAVEPLLTWRLVSRECLNPGSLGAPTYLVGLQPLQPCTWQAGDILEVQVCQAPARVHEWMQSLGLAEQQVSHDGEGRLLSNVLAECVLPEDAKALLGLAPQALLQALEPLPRRDYSIASLPADGVLELLVRQQHQADGSLGLGSGWLTVYAPLGQQLRARLRNNRGFHLPSDDRPLILIGNGTGLAGLRSLLRARVAAGQRRNWLLFGERSAAHDFYCRDELQGYLADGSLARLDLAFSRDQAERLYVQQRLRAAADELRSWLQAGAALYVCGSLQGMAAEVDGVLRELLGETALQALVEDGRYRRDVY